MHDEKIVFSDIDGIHFDYHAVTLNLLRSKIIVIGVSL